ncbi:hypothetical protein F4808DRAFT_444753 [Astrocystis sublimbata]|nr:hypothetical protein F4808DRAFT_444753 [Astrocystis sublimbata]
MAVRDLCWCQRLGGRGLLLCWPTRSAKPWVEAEPVPRRLHMYLPGMCVGCRGRVSFQSTYGVGMRTCKHVIGIYSIYSIADVPGWIGSWKLPYHCRFTVRLTVRLICRFGMDLQLCSIQAESLLVC